ncbi:unnamed protein product [Dovyalis caffra]|uniref:AT-hook motif nuclear-localized protein n=1 Tax=Dovyalis caffra TaxID=77055 RepID=A0AAV1S4X2_9ROSI|nr:unnamed protein product [Dovyalis caffra]
MRLAFSTDGAAVYKAITTATTTAAASPTYQPGGVEGLGGGAVVSPHGTNVNMGGGNGGESMKRKRGRPRKYGPDGTMALSLASAPLSIAVTQPTSTATGSGGFSSPPGQSPSQAQPLVSPPPPPPASEVGVVGAAGVVSPPPHATPGGSVSPSGVKKARGRPPGSSKKHQLAALGSAGFGFTPHVITVKAGESGFEYCNHKSVGDIFVEMRIKTTLVISLVPLICEDVSSKIMSFSQHGPRAVCILSANGAISNVTLRQQATSGGTVTYEGRFEILTLSGSYLPSENGGQRSRTGGLSVCLSGPDGRVLGGSVAGLLIAAAPVQAGNSEDNFTVTLSSLSLPPSIIDLVKVIFNSSNISECASVHLSSLILPEIQNAAFLTILYPASVVVGSFVSGGRKVSKSANHMEPSSATSKLPPTGGSTGVSSPPSRGTLSESSGGPGSPLNQSTGACNNSNPQGMLNMPWK